MPGIVLPTVHSLLGWHNVKDHGALGDGTTDDTAAIQAAIDACDAAGGGTVYFPPGTYYLGTAPTTRGAGYTANKQILHLPSRTASTGSAPITVRLYGGTPAPNLAWGIDAPNPAVGSGVTLVTDQTDVSGSGAAGMIGCAASTSSALVNGSTYFSAVYAIVEAINFQTYDNPNISGLRLDNVMTASVKDVAVYSSSMTKSVFTTPTNTAAVGIAMPVTYNAARNYLDRCLVINMYRGITLTEHCRAGSLAVAMCMEAVHAGPCTHGMTIHHLLTQSNANHLVIDQGGATVPITVLLHETEVKTTNTQAPFLGSTPYALDDAGNYAHGSIAYHNIFGSAGYAINGTHANLTLTDCGSTV